MKQTLPWLAFALLLAWSAQPALPCPDAERLIDHLVKAHGGMEAWASAPTVSFEDEFLQGDAESGASSIVTVEQGRRRAYIDYPGTDMRLAWDGERAWSENWASPRPPRFLALLNYHFANLPWLVHDPGVVMSEFGTRRLPGDPTDYFSVKITYEAGTGDTPKDYYRLYVHPDTHLLRATEYIVTYRSILPEGIEATPPNTLIYDEFETVDGLVVPKHYTIYSADGEVYFRCAFRNWSFTGTFDESRMTMPEGAVVDTSLP